MHAGCADYEFMTQKGATIYLPPTASLVLSCCSASYACMMLLMQHAICMHVLRVHRCCRTFVLSDLNTVGPADAATIALRMHRGLSVALFHSPHHARQMQVGRWGVVG